MWFNPNFDATGPGETTKMDWQNNDGVFERTNCTRCQPVGLSWNSCDFWISQISYHLLIPCYGSHGPFSSMIQCFFLLKTNKTMENLHLKWVNQWTEWWYGDFPIAMPLCKWPGCKLKPSSMRFPMEVLQHGDIDVFRAVHGQGLTIQPGSNTYIHLYIYIYIYVYIHTVCICIYASLPLRSTFWCFSRDTMKLTAYFNENQNMQWVWSVSLPGNYSSRAFVQS